MKRSLLLLFFVHLLTMAFSQITIKRADYTVSGVIQDTSKSKGIKIIGLSIPQRGANRTWDYTMIQDTITLNLGVNSPANVATLTPEFKDATFFFRPRPAFGSYSIIDTQYLKLDTTGYYILGYKRGSIGVSITAQTDGSSDSLFFLSRLIRYNNSPYVVKLPMTSTTLSKVLTIDTLPYLLKWISAGYATKANVLHVRRYEYTTEVVGWGTLVLRNPVLGRANLSFAALFERYSELRQDSFYLNGAPMPQRVLDTFRLTQGKRDTANMIYSLRGLGFKRGILTFTMSANEAFILSATRVIEPSQTLLEGSKDLASYDVPLTVFPNPVTEGVTLSFDKKTSGTWHTLIYNEKGQMIDLQSINAPQGNITHHITLDKSLPSGNYFINILDETSLIRSNGRFVKL